MAIQEGIYCLILSQMKKIKNKVKNIKENTTKNTIISFFLLILSISFFTTSFISTINKNLKDNILYASIGKDALYNEAIKLKTAKQKHDFFYNKITPLEKRSCFASKYNGWVWAYGVSETRKTIDCLNSWKDFYKQFGAKVENASIPGLTQRLNIIKAKNPRTPIIRRTLKEVVPGDYIILYYSERNRHIGMVTDVTPNGWVRYASVEVQTGTETLNIVRFYDPHIVYIAEMDEGLFGGDITYIGIQNENRSDIK